MLAESEASNVMIDRFWEGPRSELGFLSRFAGQIRRVEVASEKIVDLSGLETLPNLEAVVIECSVETLDFRKLTRLRECLLAHPATLGNVQDCSSLAELALFGLRVTDLAALSSMSNLRRLHLHQLRQLTSLDGIQQLSLERVELVDLTRLRSVVPLAALRRLRSLSLTGCRRIADLPTIEALASLETLSIIGGPQIPTLQFLKRLTNLRELGIWNTHVNGEQVSLASLKQLRSLRTLKLISVGTKIHDIDALGSLTSLEILSLDRGPKLPSVRFLRTLKNLRELNISRTEIGDGDLHVLLELPRLQRIHGLSPHRKHYSHRLEDLDAVLQARHPDRPSGPQPDAMQEAVDRVFRRVAGNAQGPSSQIAALGDAIRDELIAHFGSWEDLYDAVATELKTVAKDGRLKNRFSQRISLAGHDITVVGTMVRGRASIEMIRFAGEDLPDSH